MNEISNKKRKRLIEGTGLLLSLLRESVDNANIVAECSVEIGTVDEKQSSADQIVSSTNDSNIVQNDSVANIQNTASFSRPQ